MKPCNSRIVLSIALLFAWISAQSQINLSFRATTFSYQITETQPELVKLKISSDGKIAFEPGVLFAFETYASSNTALKISQSFIMDKALQLAGASQIMIKFRVAKSFKHVLHIGIGPVLHFRKSWAGLENYVNEPVYNTWDEWQYKFGWISGEVEYNYYLNKRTDLSISLNHVQAESLGISAGIKHWISRAPSKKRGCVACPGLH